MRAGFTNEKACHCCCIQALACPDEHHCCCTQVLACPDEHHCCCTQVLACPDEHHVRDTLGAGSGLRTQIPASPDDQHQVHVQKVLRRKTTVGAAIGSCNAASGCSADDGKVNQALCGFALLEAVWVRNDGKLTAGAARDASLNLVLCCQNRKYLNDAVGGHSFHSRGDLIECCSWLHLL